MNKRPDGKAWSFHAFVTRFGITTNLVNRFARYTALAAVLALVTSTSYAQSNAAGAIFGRVVGSSSSDLSGAKATLTSKDFNINRTTPVSSVGSFDFPGVPVGDYEVTLSMKGREPLAQSAHVGLGTTSSVRFEPSAMDTVKLEKLVVSAQNASPIDVASTSIGLNIRAETVNLLPVGRDITSVAMLTPGVSKGDTGFFGNLSSFAGASVAENAYYLNGFNITDFRRGLGYGTVPFNFFNEFQVLTSGYSAEFGRSTGGVVNAISKRGTNNYQASASVIWNPAGLDENGFDSYRTTGALYIVRSIGSRESKSYNIEASGPLWKNHLYFYGLYQGRDSKSNFMSGTTQWQFAKNKDPFWSGKIDYQITPNHAVEYTTFSDKSTTTTERFNYPLVSANGAFTRPAALGTNLGNTYFDGGGRSNIYRYAGNFLDNTLTFTALYGTSVKNSTSRTDVFAQPYVVDNRTTTQVLSGAASVTEDVDRRHAKRADATYRFSFLGSHTLKFGYDNENNKAHTKARATGDGTRYVYDSYTAGSKLANNAVAPAGTTQTASISQYFTGGDFRVITEAMYIEDNWKLMEDRLSLNLGFRREMLDNRNGNDVTFIKIENMKAPRISGSYDLKGDGLSKVFGSWGRYFLQIPANTAARMASGETFYSDYFVLNSLKPDFTPNVGAQIGARVITGTGIVPGVETIVNAEIQPMYQDEFTIGYERAIGKKWKASIMGIYRNLAQTLEDEAVDAALLKYAKGKGYNKFELGGFDYYVLTNPGANATFYVNMTKDLDGDGIVDINDQSGSIATKEKVTLDAASLGYPKASRKYYAVQLELERKYADKWFANFSYVWTHSYGNYEGSVYSDIGQSDAGITQLFDQPGLVDGTYGNLPNDRRHTFKTFGAYQITKELTLSGSFIYQSGRAISALGLHPTDVYARAYGAASMYRGGVLMPRGSSGTTPWTCNIDLGAKYKPTWGKNKISFGMDVFNVPNWQTTTGVREQSELSNGSPDNRYKKPRAIQTPRSVRFSMTLDY